MTDRYHYDSKGNYIGKSSDTPPSSGIGGAIGLIIILVILFKGCSSSDSPSPPQREPQANSQAADTPQQSGPIPAEPQSEQKPKWVIKD